MTYSFPVVYAPADHEQAMSRYFGKSLENTAQELGPAEGREMVLVSFINRSGSNLLCDLLGTDPRFSKGQEIFDHAFVTRVCDDMKIDTFAGFIRGMVMDAARRDQKLCAKISWDQLYMLTRLGVLSPPAMRCKFLHISREDKIDQAISYFLAERSQVWIALKDDEVRAHTTIDALTDDDYKAIVKKLDWIYFSESRFELYYSLMSVDPFRITYEELVGSSYQATLARIQEYLGVEPLEGALGEKFHTSMKKQATGLNLEIREQLLNRFDLGNLSASSIRTPETV